MVVDQQLFIFAFLYNSLHYCIAFYKCSDCYNLWVDWYGRLGWKEHFASPHSCLFGGYVCCYNCCHSNHNLGRVNNTLQNSYLHSVVPVWLPRFWGQLTLCSEKLILPYSSPSGHEYCYEPKPMVGVEWRSGRSAQSFVISRRLFTTVYWLTCWPPPFHLVM